MLVHLSCSDRTSMRLKDLDSFYLKHSVKKTPEENSFNYEKGYFRRLVKDKSAYYGSKLFGTSVLGRKV